MWNNIKLILKSVREYKIYAILSPLFMVGEAAIECATPFIVSLLINNMREGTLTIQDVLWPYGGVLVIMAIVSLLCGIGGGITAAKASTGLAKNLRVDLYKKISSFSFANIDKFSNASLITRMTTDISNVQMAFQMVVRIVIRAPLMLIFSATMAFITGGYLAFVFIGIIPVVVAGFLIIFKKVMPIFKRVFKKYDKLNQSVEENISGIRVVKSYVRESYEIDKFNNASSAITTEFIKAEKILSFANPLMNTAIHVCNLLICALGAWIIVDHVDTNFEVGTISALITYGVQILMSLLMISMITVMLSMSLEAIRRVSEVLNEEPTITNPENPIYEIKNGDISFENVNFKYFKDAERNALENISINIKSGQFVGIIGSTGSGKTTLINLISRLYDVSEGVVKVGDEDVRNYDLKTLRDNVAVVLQKNLLFYGSIADNLRWGDINASDEELKKACQIAQAEEFISQLPEGYLTHIEQGGTNVSGGQKQRLCIARALLKKPKILILDDSTSAVDTKTDKLIREALSKEIPNTTKIVIAQRTSSIESADQIIVLDDGKIDAIGTHESLLKNNKIYQEVYTSQTKKGGK